MIPQFGVVCWAIAAGTHSQYATLANRYVVNGDAPAAIYWLQRFRDPMLFRNDLLTDFAVQMHGQWGFVLFYRLASLVADPLLVSRVIPIVLLAIFALYVFKFVRHFSTTFAAVLTAGLAVTVPTYLEIMSGGHQRAFALPLLAAFMYYLSSGSWRIACAVLALVAMFYPMVFLVCAITYLLAVMSPPWDADSLRRRLMPVAWFAVVLLICALPLAVKYMFAPNPQIGRLVTRAQMEGQAQFYPGGRSRVLPTRSLATEFSNQVIGLSRALTIGYPHLILESTPKSVPRRYLAIPALVALGIIGWHFLRATRRGQAKFPREIPFLVAAGIAMFLLANWALFKLYLPNRYLIYPVQFAGLLTAGLVCGYLFEALKNPSMRRAAQILALALVAVRVDVARGVGLYDATGDGPLYQFLETLPADAVIASHPDLSDFIPTFSRRKVFVNFELSSPFFATYWQTIADRTRSLFDAYYAGTRQEAFDFCERNNVDFLIVRARDFDPRYLSTHRIYFEPFDQYVRGRLAAGGDDYALTQIEPHEMAFRYGDTFVISRDRLRVPPGHPNAAAALVTPPSTGQFEERAQ